MTGSNEMNINNAWESIRDNMNISAEQSLGYHFFFEINLV